MQVRGSYASIGGSHQLTGRLDGMNEHGLTIGLHLVKVLPRFPGLTSTLLVRRVLDSCATTAEAIDLLVVASMNRPKGSLPDVDALGFPIERRWAESHPESFEPLYGVAENDPLFRIYKIRGDSTRR